MLEDYAPEIPDWANDQHTIAGRKLGRGLDHFRQEARSWCRRQRRKMPTRTKW